MTVFKAIVAWCGNSGIGYKGELPWNLKGDLRRFARLTKGEGNNAVIMGRKTWDSLPNKPLPGRHNIVLSQTLGLRDMEGKVSVVPDVSTAISLCEREAYVEAWIMGGSKIYEAFASSSLIQEVHATEIDAVYKCDTHLPHGFTSMLCSMKQQNIEPFEVDYLGNIITGMYVKYVTDDGLMPSGKEGCL